MPPRGHRNGCCQTKVRWPEPHANAARAFQPTEEQWADAVKPRQPTRQLSLLVNPSRTSAPTTAHFLGGDWIWRQRSRWSRGLQADNRQSKNRFSGPQRHACRSLSVGTTKVQPFTEKSLEGFYFVKFINYRQETLKNLGQKLNLWRKLKIIDKKFCRLLKKSYLCTRNT